MDLISENQFGSLGNNGNSNRLNDDLVEEEDKTNSSSYSSIPLLIMDPSNFLQPLLII